MSRACRALYQDRAAAQVPFTWTVLYKVQHRYGVCYEHERPRINTGRRHRSLPPAALSKIFVSHSLPFVLKLPRQHALPCSPAYKWSRFYAVRRHLPAGPFSRLDPPPCVLPTGSVRISCFFRNFVSGPLAAGRALHIGKACVHETLGVSWAGDAQSQYLGQVAWILV